MLTCLVLGMGIPTIPNYIITSSLAGPALLELGVPLLVSHMFVFYFGIMADLTPPVALAAFAAAPMAKESGLKIGVQATQARDRRLRRAVHGRLHAGADAAGRRPDRARLRLSGGGRLHPAQGLPRHRALGRGGRRLPGRARWPGGSALAALRARACCWCWRCRSPTRPASRLPHCLVGQHWWRSRGAHGGAGRAHEPLHRSPPARRSRLAVAAFTLSWTHSVERTRWEEDWTIGPAGLQIVEARVQGLRRRHGAGRRRGPRGRLVGLAAAACRRGRKSCSPRQVRPGEGWTVCGGGRCGTSVGERPAIRLLLKACRWCISIVRNPH